MYLNIGLVVQDLNKEPYLGLRLLERRLELKPRRLVLNRHKLTQANTTILCQGLSFRTVNRVSKVFSPC